VTKPAGFERDWLLLPLVCPPRYAVKGRDAGTCTQRTRCWPGLHRQADAEVLHPASLLLLTASVELGWEGAEVLWLAISAN